VTRRPRTAPAGQRAVCAWPTAFALPAQPARTATAPFGEPTAGPGSSRPTDLRTRSRWYVVSAPESSSASSCPNSASSASSRDVRTTSDFRGSAPTRRTRRAPRSSSLPTGFRTRSRWYVVRAPESSSASSCPNSASSASSRDVHTTSDFRGAAPTRWTRRAPRSSSLPTGFRTRSRWYVVSAPESSSASSCPNSASSAASRDGRTTSVTRGSAPKRRTRRAPRRSLRCARPDGHNRRPRAHPSKLRGSRRRRTA
jgi:hypothetical protein